MVKRPKSPDVVEDARYFTVCQPFPLNANWVFEDDQQDCATWIAECIGPEHLYAIHYKPSARGMILLEVSKMFTDHERLLGEHRWSELLKEPSDEEEKRVSRVFHSFYSKGREAQKDGWKNLAVKSAWFKRDWSPGKGRFKQPYPPTRWCPIPIEDKTGKQLCRPLPVDKIAPPPTRVEQPVVGSLTWNEKKNASKPTAATLTKAWDGETSSTNVVNKVGEPVQPKPNAGSSVPKSPVVTSPTLSTAGVATAVPNKSQPNSNSAPSRKNNKKNKAIPLNQFVAGEGDKTSKKPYTILNTSSSPAVKLPLDEPPRSANAWDNPIQLPVSPAPAVVVRKEAPSEDLSSWGKEAAIPTIDQEKIWSAPLPNSKKKKANKGKGTATASTLPASVTSQGNKTQPLSPPPRAVPKFRPSAEEEEEDSDDGDDIYTALSKMKYTEIDDLAPEELEHAHINTWEKGEDDNNNNTVEPKSEEEDPAKAKEEDRAYGNLWLSEEDPRAIPLPKLICPTHRITCKKGICEDMTKLLRAEKRKELEAKWEAEEKNKKKKKGKKKKDAAAKSGSSGDNNNKDDDAESKAATSTAEVDGDNFAIARPRGRFGKHNKKAQDGWQVKESSHIGRMRAFPDDNAPSDHADGEAAVAAAAPGGWNYVATTESADQW